MATRVFAENFRGFRELDISLENSAFLVGDNSSGKTSILHLVDYAISTELEGTPRLNESVGVGLYDFFSPYFDYANVTIGIEIPLDDGIAWKVITIERREHGFHPKVVACSYAFDSTVYSLRVDGVATLARVDILDTPITKASLLLSHHNAKGMTEATKGREDRRAVNDYTVAHMALQRAGLVDTSDETLSNALYVGPREAIRHLGPLRSKPERYYQPDRRHRSTGSHFAPMFRDVRGPDADELKAAIDKFGQDSKLFDHFEVSPISESMDDSPLIVTVERNGRPFLISQVGVGVSQVAPILVDAAFAIQSGIDTVILVQQPELHLHPVAQAALGEFLFEVSGKGLVTLCETHSDYLIDRFRARVRETGGDRSGGCVLYCFSDAEGNHCERVEISKDGSLENPPEKYFEFFINEYARTAF